MIVIKIPKEDKENLVKRLQNYFYEERSEEIGDLAAEFLLDFMIKEMGPVIYNQAIDDSVKLVGQKMIAMEEDLQSIKQTMKRN
ncbi:DUF2164 domain-containing protein [Paenibacillus eucommiae]|uniref:Uncharacterized protein (DUF2164 family) n=1 Tax=Paenibacillus eucommiae TaxID=1355755 RepID=A0ABS4J2J4_9BACL|nr:uncharacterized protein (DUF2164 family) [Paenibacillus eucommiae]